MSGTRSRFPKATAIEALIVAHGQPSEPARAERALADLAARVRAHLPDAQVNSATLAAPGKLGQAAEQFAGRFAVYPLFMAAGWFVTDLLRRRLQGAPADLLAPMGLDPGLPTVAARAVVEAAGRRGWKLEETEVLLAAHGSATGPAAARSAERFATALRRRLPGRVRVGYIEQAPYVDRMTSRLGSRALCLPFFAANGRHVRFDLRQALADAGRSDALLAPLGLQPEIPELIARAIGDHAARAEAAA